MRIKSFLILLAVYLSSSLSMAQSNSDKVVWSEDRKLSRQDFKADSAFNRAAFDIEIDWSRFTTQVNDKEQFLAKYKGAVEAVMLKSKSRFNAKNNEDYVLRYHQACFDKVEIAAREIRSFLYEEQANFKDINELKKKTERKKKALLRLVDLRYNIIIKSYNVTLRKLSEFEKQVEFQMDSLSHLK